MASTMDEKGTRIKEARIDHRDPTAFAVYFRVLPEPSAVVMEACWNWGWLYDQLGELPQVDQVVLSHPGKTRIIAEAQIKTDRIDARALATLLRGHLLATVHAPSPEVRARKHVLRQRAFRVRMRTMVRNRIHTLVDRQRNLPQPEFSDLFGKKGIHWLKTIALPEPDATLLTQELRELELLGEQIKSLETSILQDNQQDLATQRLQTIPGLGDVLAAVIAAEVDGMERFASADKFVAYAGLVPSTYASGGKVSHGRMLVFCNRWLKWAFIEGAWVAVGCSAYFGDFYHRQQARGKKSHTAITIVARRMARIVWHLLRENRDFTEAVPKLALSPAASVAD